MKELKIEDFRECEVCDCEADIEVWGQKSGLIVDYNGGDVTKILPQINELLEKLEGSKEKIVTALIEDDMLDLAEEWVSNGGEDENGFYTTIDGAKIKFPITEEFFADSLRVDGLTIYADEDSDDISTSLFLMCKPDFFAYNGIEIFLEYIDGELNIEVNGIAG